MSHHDFSPSLSFSFSLFLGLYPWPSFSFSPVFRFLRLFLSRPILACFIRTHSIDFISPAGRFNLLTVLYYLSRFSIPVESNGVLASTRRPSIMDDVTQRFASLSTNREKNLRHCTLPRWRRFSGEIFNQPQCGTRLWTEIHMIDPPDEERTQRAAVPARIIARQIHSYEFPLNLGEIVARGTRIEGHKLKWIHMELVTPRFTIVALEEREWRGTLAANVGQ